MSRAIATAALAGLLAATGCPRRGAEPAAPVVEGSADIVTAAKGSIEKWRQAYEVRSVEGLAALYAHDEKVILVQEGVAIVGWKAIEAMLKERLGKVTTAHVRMRDLVVVPIDTESATATATMTRELGDVTTTLTETGTVSLVLHRVANVWLIVHEHYSYKRPTSSP